MLSLPEPHRRRLALTLALLALLAALLLAALQTGLLGVWELHRVMAMPSPWSLGGTGALAAALLLLATGRARSASWLATALGLLALGALLAHLLLTGSDAAAALALQVPASLSFALALLAGGTAGLAVLRNGVAGPLARAAAFAALLVLLESWLDGAPLGRRLLHGAEIGPPALLLALLAPAAAALALLPQGQPEDGPQREIDRWAAWGPVLLAGLTFIAWSELEDREWGERLRDTELAGASIAEGISDRLRLRAAALQRLADRGALYYPSQAQWEREAHDYLRDFPSFHALMQADAQRIVRWRVATDGSVDLVGSLLGNAPDRLPPYQQAASTGRPWLTPPLQLPGGGTGLVMVAAMLDGGELRGYLTASIPSSALLEAASSPVLRDFAVQLRTGSTVLTGDPQPGPRLQTLAQRRQIDALGQPWTLEVWPRPAYLQRMRSRMPEAVFLLGMLAAGLVAAAILQARRSVASTLAAQAWAERLTTTLESINDAFFTMDADWRFTYVNREAERLLQRDRRQLLGRVLWEEFPYLYGTALESHYHRAMAQRQAVAFEDFFEPLGKWFAVRGYPTRTGLAIYFEDVTELVNSREALRRSEQELRALAESMPQMVWMAQPDGAATYFNQRWMDYTGLTLEQSRGDGWMQALHPDDRAAAEAGWRATLAAATDQTQEARLRRADGAYRWMLVRAVPFRGPDGKILKWMGTNTDIHALRLSMEAVRASEERFRLLARASNDAIWDADLRSGEVWWSESFDVLFGANPAGSFTLEHWRERLHPDDREAVQTAVRQTLEQGQDVWNAECRFQRANGEWARVHMRGYAIRDEAGRPVRMVGGMSDITARAELEQQLRQSQRLESVGQLTGGVAHDFNNLLTVILGNAETLADELADAPHLQPMAQLMLTAAERGAELTRRLLAFARRQALAPEAVDLARQLSELVPLLRHTLGAHISIQVELPPDLWRAHVDPAQLDNALLNLCLNARDAMPSGGTLSLSAANAQLASADSGRQHDVPPGDYVLLTVSDTGTGIAPEHAERIFEPFFTTKETGKGTGLGLSMVYGFVKQSGGQIGVHSEPGHGTRFTLYLPRATTAAATPRPRLAALREAQPDATVLLVEDDPLVRSHARNQLLALGYRVLAAASAAEALDLLGQQLPVDLLFTDLVMPGPGGVQLAQQARTLRPGLRVLYTSGYAEDLALHQGRLDADLLPKPYSRDELARRLRAALQAGR